MPDWSRVAAPAFALLLVVSLMAGGVGLQPAAAAHDCSALDAMVGFATLWNVNYETCSEHLDSSVEEVRDATTNQSKLDIYNAATAQKANNQVTLTVYDNYLNDTEGAAWMQAEAAIAEAYENGSSKAVSKNKARQAIADYYAKKQINLIESWNVTVSSFTTLRERAANESDINTSYVAPEAPVNYPAGVGGGWEYNGVSNETITLVNGTTVGVKAIIMDGRAMTGSGAKLYYFYPTGPDGTHNTWTNDAGGTNEVWFEGFHVKAPNSNYEKIVFGKLPGYFDRMNQIEAQNDGLQAEVDPFVNNTWTAFENGQINSSDVLSTTTLMTQYGIDYKNDTGNLYNTVAALSSLGLSAPELNGTGTMTVSYQNYEYHGLVMAREAPNGTWKANSTYNASNISGPVILVTTDGTKIDLNGEFTIETISATDGSTLSNVTATKVVYKTSNTTELLEMMERIENLRKQVEAKEQAAASGSSSGSGIPNSQLLIGALVLLGVGAAAMRGDH